MSDSSAPSSDVQPQPSEGTPAPAPASPAPAAPAAKRESLMLNIIFNIAAPSVILSWLSEPKYWQWLGNLVGSQAFATPDGDSAKLFASACGMGLAVIFPIVYGIYDLATRRKTNVISILGFLSVLITGGMGLMKADGFWFAVKDAGIPLLIGAMVIITQRTKRPLVRELLYNDQVLNTPRIEAALAERGNLPAFTRLLNSCSYLMALSFVVSAIIGFCLARYLLKSPPGTPEFNNELGRMHFWSWPINIVPTMAIGIYALWRLITGIEKLSGLSFDDLMLAPEEKKTEEGK